MHTVYLWSILLCLYCEFLVDFRDLLILRRHWGQRDRNWQAAAGRLDCFFWIASFCVVISGVDDILWRCPLFISCTRMMTSSNGNIFRVTGPLCGEFTGPGEFPTRRPVTRCFNAFFDLRLNKQLSKQPWGWWFETPSWPLWRQYNGHKLPFFRKKSLRQFYSDRVLIPQTACSINVNIEGATISWITQGITWASANVLFLEPQEQTLMEFQWKFDTFLSRKWTGKCHLQ